MGYKAQYEIVVALRATYLGIGHQKSHGIALNTFDLHVKICTSMLTTVQVIANALTLDRADMPATRGKFFRCSHNGRNLHLSILLGRSETGAMRNIRARGIFDGRHVINSVVGQALALAVK